MILSAILNAALISASLALACLARAKHFLIRSITASPAFSIASSLAWTGVGSLARMQMTAFCTLRAWRLRGIVCIDEYLQRSGCETSICWFSTKTTRSRGNAVRNASSQTGAGHKGMVALGDNVISLGS